MADRTYAAASIQIGAGREISFLAVGEGKPVVLLHGVGSAARSWERQLASPPDGYRLIAWDAPGYGKSTKLDGPTPAPREYADAFQAFVTALALPRFHVVGHSLGALIAACFARHYPAALISLTLASIAPGHARLDEAERLRLRNARLDLLDTLGARGMAESRGPTLLSPNATDDMRRAVVETMAAIRPDGWRQAVFMLSQGDTRGDLAEVPPHISVQIVYGSKDTVTPPESNRRTAEARPNAPIHVIDGAGHAVYVEKADEFNRIVRVFLDAHRSQRSSP